MECRVKPGNDDLGIVMPGLVPGIPLSRAQKIMLKQTAKAK
jgi:hypothetical protein